MGFKFIMFALIGLTLAMLASAQTKPKPCGFPGVYTSDVSILIHQPAVEEDPEILILTETVYYFDKPNKRIALNITATVLNSKEPKQHYYQIEDYYKDIMYFINGDTCIQIPMEGDFPTEAYCVPNSAEFIDTVKFGETLAVNRWLSRDDESNERFEFTTTEEKCVPVTLVGTVGLKDVFMTAYEYFNFKPSIDKPDKIFTPPASCNNAPILKMPHRVQKLPPFGIHLLMNPKHTLSTEERSKHL